MRFEKCWCGSEKSYLVSEFKTGLFYKKGLKVKIAKCLNCGTVRMFDNSLKNVPDYESSYYYSEVSKRHLRTISLIEKYFNGDSILDIGCNTGVLLNEIRLRVPQITRLKGVDLDSNAIEEGRKRYNLDLEAMDASNLHDKFDNIVLCHTLEHISNLKLFADIINKLLLPGGNVFIAVPNIESIGGRYFLRFWPALSPEFHLWYFNASSILYFFKTTLPNFNPVFVSSFFIWKPFVIPGFIWKYLQNNKKILKGFENNLKGDQLDVVFTKFKP